MNIDTSYIFAAASVIKFKCVLPEAIFTEIRAISSVGSEHLVYTEGVGSSSLSSPTKKQSFKAAFFFVLIQKYSLGFYSGRS